MKTYTADELMANIDAVIKHLPKDCVVEVCEGLGPEDRVATLAVSVSKLKQLRDLAERRAAHTLATNLCPDHRDKQAGKPCLACTIERVEHLLWLHAPDRTTHPVLRGFTEQYARGTLNVLHDTLKDLVRLSRPFLRILEWDDVKTGVNGNGMPDRYALTVAIVTKDEAPTEADGNEPSLGDVRRLAAFLAETRHVWDNDGVMAAEERRAREAAAELEVP